MKKFLPIIVLLGLSLPVVIAAADPLPNLPLIETIEKIAGLIFTILIAISLIFLVYAGILFVTAAGKVEQVEQARHIILYAIIGLIVAALAYGVREFLRSQLGF